MNHMMKIIAKPIKSVKLKPGDLFSLANQFYWDHRDPAGIGEKVYIRTDAPCPKDQEDVDVYKIEIRR